MCHTIKIARSTADIQRTSERRTVAVIAMVMGIIGVLTAWLFAAGLPFAIIAVVLASIALLQRRPGKPFAVAGLVLGVSGLLSALELWYGWLLRYIRLGTRQ